jgi:hypothetical protein
MLLLIQQGLDERHMWEIYLIGLHRRASSGEIARYSGRGKEKVESLYPLKAFART